MNGFISKKLNSIKTLGERLEEHRISLGLSLDEAARHININSRYLRMLEKNKYNDLPADIYTINILKHYAELLELNPHNAVEIYQKEKDVFLKTTKKKEVKITLWQRIMNFFLNPVLIKYSLVSLLILAILGYLGWSVNRIVSPPMLMIDSPKENEITNSPKIVVSGKTEKEVSLSINNQPILSDTAGSFSQAIDLQKDINIIKIAAHKKYSKTQTIYRKVIYIETAPENKQ